MGDQRSLNWHLLDIIERADGKRKDYSEEEIAEKLKETEKNLKEAMITVEKLIDEEAEAALRKGEAFLQETEAALQKTMDTETKPVTVPPSKRQKFIELTNRRVNNALKAISLIGTLSNKNTYEYSKEDVAKIFKALDETIASVRQRFETKKPEQGSGFRL